MDKHYETKNTNKNKDNNWVDDLLERQEHDLEVEEEILGSVPKRMRQKYLKKEEE